MKFKIDTTLERDVDLLILEEFSVDKEFAKLFLNFVGVFDDFEIVESIHSKVDAEYGESDIVFILKVNNKLHALHIEDKINAIAMPKQYSRYFLRGEKDMDNGEYDSFSVVIVAPKRYLEMNKEAQKYENKVTYEQMVDFFEAKDDVRSNYKVALLKRAITEQGSGYQWEANPNVVRFCGDMYEYQRAEFPGMTKGTTAWWPTFKTIHKEIEIQFKANKGHCDLAFTRVPYHELYKSYKDKIYGEMQIVKTGKSSAIRIEVNPIEFEADFFDVVDDVKKALCAIKVLLDFGNSLVEITQD